MAESREVVVRRFTQVIEEVRSDYLGTNCIERSRKDSGWLTVSSGWGRLFSTEEGQKLMEMLLHKGMEWFPAL